MEDVLQALHDYLKLTFEDAFDKACVIEHSGSLLVFENVSSRAACSIAIRDNSIAVNSMAGLPNGHDFVNLPIEDPGSIEKAVELVKKRVRFCRDDHDRQSLVTARRLLYRALQTIQGLADQQAMPDPWYEPVMDNITRYFDGIAAEEREELKSDD